jgi:hypothetical protein
LPNGKKSINIHRTGMGLDQVLVVTDYWTQGMSFKQNKFIIDIVPPPTRFLGASIRVPLSRYGSFSDIHLLRPLWKENDKEEQEKITNKLWNALQSRYNKRITTSTTTRCRNH